jgi:hypothetical protein
MGFEQSYGWASQCRLGAAPRRRPKTPPKRATFAASGQAGTLVRGAAGGWLYAKGEVEYEATPEVEYEAKGEA